MTKNIQLNFLEDLYQKEKTEGGVYRTINRVIRYLNYLSSKEEINYKSELEECSLYLGLIRGDISNLKGLGSQSYQREEIFDSRGVSGALRHLNTLFIKYDLTDFENKVLKIVIEKLEKALKKENDFIQNIR